MLLRMISMLLLNLCLKDCELNQHYSYKGCWSTHLLGALLRESALHAVRFMHASYRCLPGTLSDVRSSRPPCTRLVFWGDPWRVGRGRDQGHLSMKVFVMPACFISCTHSRAMDEAGSACWRRLSPAELLRLREPSIPARPTRLVSVGCAQPVAKFPLHSAWTPSGYPTQRSACSPPAGLFRSRSRPTRRRVCSALL